MERPKDIVVILREALLMNGLRNFTDLGQLRQKTIEKKLTENRPKLSANHLASIYLLWLRHGSAARMETDTEIDNSVKAIFHFLEPKGCKWSQIKAIWKDCMETVTKETKPQRHRLVIVNRSMTACLKDLKHRERAATSDYPSLDGPYSEPRRKPSSIFKRGTSLSPVIQTVNPPLTAPRTEPPLAQLNRLHNRQRPVIIDLTQESWKEVEPAMTRPFFKENHPPRMLVEPICLPWEAVQPSEGRLSPWDDDHVQDSFTPEKPIRGSRAEMIAYLEADSFLAELGRELQEDAIAKMKQYAGLGASRRDECFHQGLHKGDNDDRQSNGMEALHFKGSQSSDYHNTVMGN